MKKNTSVNVLKIALLLFIILLVLLRFEIIGSPMLNMSFRYSDKKIERIFENQEHSPSIKHLKFRDKSLRYLELITNPDLPYVVFVHGAPGSSADYLEYFKTKELTTKVNLIDVDRLGYGYSEFGISETSIQKQAEAIQFIINKTSTNKQVILVGHSYGGPIVLRMAMDYPQVYESILLLAPAIDPENEKEIKIGQLAMVQPTRWLTPRALQVAADEKFSHVDELMKMLPLYDRIKTPVIHIHGTKDSLVPYENLNFSKNHINPAFLEAITLENVDHFLPWSHQELIIQTILEMAEGS